MIRVLVADDHAIVREGVRRVLEGEPDIAIVAEAGSAPEAVALAKAEQPDIVVLDVSMRGESGLRAAARITQSVPGARILLLSMHDNPEYVREGMRTGARGYVLKDAAATELPGAIRTVHHGGQWLSGPLRQHWRDDPAAGAPDLLATLTPRERDVLVGVALGRTNREIAAELGISHRTVETHRETLMRKLDIHTVAGLTAFAIERGQVTR
ncbi:MAG TPA: response regulator transcription factor [Gemmatimonadales bacterium]|nr:response regulator transcription factor [Gemmatimonadales bacterium]